MTTPRDAALIAGMDADTADLYAEAVEDHTNRPQVPLPTHALRVLTSYDAQIRRDADPTWDTVAAVANCDDGWMGAWGEVMDVAASEGYPLSEGDDRYFDLAYDTLHDLFLAYQATLRREVAARG